MQNDDRRIYEKPGHLIRQLQQISLALFMEETRRFDVTPVQYSAVLAIENYSGIDQTALCTSSRSIVLRLPRWSRGWSARSSLGAPPEQRTAARDSFASRPQVAS